MRFSILLKSTIEAEVDVKLFSRHRRIERKTQKVVFEKTDYDYFPVHLMNWNDLKRKCSVNGEVRIEVHIEISKMSEVLEKKKVDFGEAMKECSDVTLLVEDEKFHISKLFLSFHSTYFKTLFLGSFNESKKSEVILMDIDKWEFQKFMEVIYGANDIDDDYVVAILRLADMYDVPIVRKKCEQFLMEKSKKPMREKLYWSLKYKIEDLKCLNDIKTPEDVRLAVPENLQEIDPSLQAALFEKALDLLK
ncbi:hypothetical protein CRE_21007 [Caenorhabditis remanei]|uniref:Uncharacterized protein n=1 Tax=Caenorhabditis remanei TaxID=31234 RepID=E3NKG9_CAERE|nr:hypothetical protein CRE_21007 [Caenorhabditis remanei]